MAKDLSAELASLRIKRDAPPASGGALKVLLILLVLGVLGGVGYFVGVPFLEARVFKTEVTLTEITTMSPAQASVELTATGYVIADRKSRVAPKVAGRVERVHVTQGSAVKAGDPLLELDSADNRAAIVAAARQVDAAKAEAASARARAETGLAEVAEVKQRAARERRLAEAGIAGPGIADDSDARATALERAASAAQAQARAAESNVAALRAQVDVLQVGMNNLVLTSPIDGTVINKPPQLGEFVGPQPAGVSVDMGGVEVADLASLVVELDVPEQRLHLVEAGTPAEIVLDAFPDRRFRGKASDITPQVDRAKATVMVKVAFVDPPEGALPDMSARVSFLSAELDAQAAQEPPKTVVPQAAVAERAGAKVVFAVESGRVRMVPVRLGPPFGGGFELLEGPLPGTQVVATPPQTLRDGDRIKEKPIDG